MSAAPIYARAVRCMYRRSRTTTCVRITTGTCWSFSTLIKALGDLVCLPNSFSAWDGKIGRMHAVIEATSASSVGSKETIAGFATCDGDGG